MEPNNIIVYSAKGVCGHKTALRYLALACAFARGTACKKYVSDWHFLQAVGIVRGYFTPTFTPTFLTLHFHSLTRWDGIFQYRFADLLPD